MSSGTVPQGRELMIAFETASGGIGFVKKTDPRLVKDPDLCCEDLSRVTNSKVYDFERVTDPRDSVEAIRILKKRIRARRGHQERNAA